MDLSFEAAMKSASNAIKEFLDKTKLEIEAKQKKIAIEAAERLVYYAPVWTGAYVRSMRCGIGMPDLSHEPTHDGSRPYPERVSAVTEEQIRMDTFARLRQEIMQAPELKTIYLTNTTPYADQIEYVGWYPTPEKDRYLQAAHQVFTTTILDLEFMLK